MKFIQTWIIFTVTIYQGVEVPLSLADDRFPIYILLDLAFLYGRVEHQTVQVGPHLLPPERQQQILELLGLSHHLGPIHHKTLVVLCDPANVNQKS